MKNILLALALLVMALPAAADDNVTIVRGDQRQVIDLPGNARISTGGSDNPSGVLIRGDDDIARTMLLGPRVRYYAPSPQANNPATACPSNLSVHDRNKCARDMIEAQQEILEKYND